MQTIWQFRFTVRFGIAEEEEEDALLGPLSLTTFHYKCRHFPRLCQFCPFLPLSLTSVILVDIFTTLLQCHYTLVTSAHELCYHLLQSTTRRRSDGREKKETSSQSAVLISDICKTCDHLHCLCSSSSTELDNSLNGNCLRCVLTLFRLFWQGKGKARVDN